MKKNNPTIVLVKPQLSENIGLCIRAMHNCGLDKLLIVSPREKWPNNTIIKASKNSKSIINKTKVFSSINEAVANYDFVVATSARKRFLHKPHLGNFLSLFKKIPKKNKVAILFGPEQSGLSNEDLMLCDCIFTIPVSLNKRSLNLSHSVLLMAYKWQEYFENLNFGSIKKIDLSDKESFNIFMQYLNKELKNSGFLYPKEKSKSMFNNIQSLFLRANLSKKEIQTLWGMIKVLKKPKKR